MPMPILSNRQRADESFSRSHAGLMNALAILKATQDDADQKKRQDLQDKLTGQQIASNDLTLQQKTGEQGLISQYQDRLTRDSTPGAAGPALPGENPLPSPFSDKAQSDAFKYDVVKKLRVMRGQDPGDPMAEEAARKAESDKLIGDAQAAPQLRALNIQKTTADIAATGAQTTHANAAAGQATAEAGKAAAETAKLNKETELLGTKGAKPLTADQTINNEGQLLQKYLGQAKDFIAVRDAYSKIKTTAKNPSPAGDLSFIYNYMKMLDPGSTVREGEFANAQNAGSAWTKVGSMYNKVLNGERLTDEQRKDFLSQSAGIYDSQKVIHQHTQKVFRDIATTDGLTPENVAPDLFLQDEGNGQAPTTVGRFQVQAGP